MSNENDLFNDVYFLTAAPDSVEEDLGIRKDSKKPAKTDVPPEEDGEPLSDRDLDLHPGYIDRIYTALNSLRRQMQKHDREGYTLALEHFNTVEEGLHQLGIIANQDHVTPEDIEITETEDMQDDPDTKEEKPAPDQKPKPAPKKKEPAPEPKPAPKKGPKKKKPAPKEEEEEEEEETEPEKKDTDEEEEEEDKGDTDEEEEGDKKGKKPRSKPKNKETEKEQEGEDEDVKVTKKEKPEDTKKGKGKGKKVVSRLAAHGDIFNIERY